MTLSKLRVIYRIDNIKYNIVGNIGFSKDIGDSINEDVCSLDKNVNYLLFIQLNQFDKKFIFYNMNTMEIINSIDNPDYIKLSKMLDSNNILIILKNKNKDIAALNENDPKLMSLIDKFETICFESLAKYQMKMPLLIQGKISKRFRIPAISEIIEHLKLSNELAYLDENIKHKEIIKEIIPLVKSLYKPNIKLDTESLQNVIDHYTLKAVDTFKMAIICDKRDKSKILDIIKPFIIDIFNPNNFSKSKKEYDIILNLIKGEVESLST